LIHDARNIEHKTLNPFEKAGREDIPTDFALMYFVSVQRDAAVSSLYFISLQAYSTCFGCSLYPSSGVHKTADSTTGTSHVMWKVRSVIR
jgi:hypothetical protein